MEVCGEVAISDPRSKPGMKELHAQMRQLLGEQGTD